MAPTEMVASLQVLRKLCSILFFYVLFLTLLAQKILSVITYSQEELLDIRVTSIYQHYDQEYDFPEADPFFGPPPWTLDLIPEADPKQCRRRRRGRRSGLLVRLRRRSHHSPLPSILVANVQSLDNKVDERHELPSRETSEIVSFSVSWKHGSLGVCFQSRYSHRVSSCVALIETNISLVRRRTGVYAS